MSRKHPAYRDWVRARDCEECCKSGPSECHHLKGEFNQSGAGLKAPDYLSMPLCRDCHHGIHLAIPGWEGRQREALIRTLIAAFDCGMIQVRGHDVAGPLSTQPIETKDAE